MKRGPDIEETLGAFAWGASGAMAAGKLAGHWESMSWWAVLAPAAGWYAFLVFATFLAVVVLPWLGRRS